MKHQQGSWVINKPSFGLWIAIILLLATDPVWGQIKERRLVNGREVNNSQLLRAQEIDTLQLPFWEDFSDSELVPDSTRWLYGTHVQINSGKGLKPPSLNIATFDGTDGSGIPYSDMEERGEADSLVSQPIDLSSVTPTLENTVYLSFFWQKRGNGEIPDAEDSVRLQFKDDQGIWITQWKAVGGDTTQTSSFKQELIPVPTGRFQHAGFQFKFQSFGKLTGGYDNWHIDYILLRTRRSDEDFFIRDRTISTPPTSIFKDFNSIPFEHYCGRAGEFRDSSSVIGFSLEPPEGFPASIRFGAQILNANNGTLIDEMNNTGQDGLLFNGQQFTTVEANSVDTSALNAAKTPSGLDIITKFFIRTKDSLMFNFIDPVTGDSVFFNTIDLTVNDTATSKIHLSDYYAYDDGGAETAAGVNRRNGRLAYLYVLPVEDTLTAVDIFFPNTEADQANQNLRLMVWSRLGTDEQLRHSQLIFIETSDTIDQFVRYPLSRAILASDSLYIGIQQLDEIPIFIGLDKNGDSGEKMFFNTGGVWEANSSITGNLMLRPVFGSTDDVITGLPDIPAGQRLKIYPNPLDQAVFRIQGPVEKLNKISIFTSNGREIPLHFDRIQQQVYFQGAERGIYVVRMQTDRYVQIEKIILMH